MLSIGNKIIELRKSKKWSQEDLAKQIKSSRIMIGKYERNDNAPSLEVIIKLAKALDVSVDYLLGESIHTSYDKGTIKRLEEMEKLPGEEKQRIFHFIDLIIRDFKAKQAYTL